MRGSFQASPMGSARSAGAPRQRAAPMRRNFTGGGAGCDQKLGCEDFWPNGIGFYAQVVLRSNNLHQTLIFQDFVDEATPKIHPPRIGSFQVSHKRLEVTAGPHISSATCCEVSGRPEAPRRAHFRHRPYAFSRKAGVRLAFERPVSSRDDLHEKCGLRRRPGFAQLGFPTRLREKPPRPVRAVEVARGDSCRRAGIDHEDVSLSVPLTCAGARRQGNPDVRSLDRRRRVERPAESGDSQ